MTGRNTWCSKAITTILQENKVEPNICIFKPDGCWNTEKYKCDVVKALVREYTGLESLEMWDDRVEHIGIFQQELEHVFQKNKIGFTIYECNARDSSVVLVKPLSGSKQNPIKIEDVKYVEKKTKIKQTERICKFYQLGTCKKGVDCGFAHK